MADEIAQVIELEVRGIALMVKGTVEAAQLVLRMMRAIINYGHEKIEQGKDKKLHKAEEKSVSEIMKLSEGGPAQALEIREAVAEEVFRIATEKGMHYARTTDFISNDGKLPIFIPAQEAAVWGTIIKAVTQKLLIEDEKIVAGYDRKIAEEKEKLLNASPEEREKIETLIENYTHARDEADKWVAYDEKVVNGDDITMSFQEYLKQSKGTEFEKNPEKAMAELEKGVEIGQKFSAKECFQPIRDKGYMPKTNIMFYVPDIGSVVTRTFKIDQETGLVYSNYGLKTKSGEIFQFSDHNVTSAKWNEKFLPELLDKAELLEGTECRAFDSKEKLGAYLTYHNNVTPQSQIELEKALKEGKEVFSSAETKREIEHAVSEKMKGVASARLLNNRVELRVEPDAIFRQNGKLALGLSTGETLLIGSMSNERVEAGKMVFEIEKDAPVLYVKNKDSKFETPVTITGQECKDLLDKAAQQLSNPIRNINHGRR